MSDLREELARRLCMARFGVVEEQVALSREWLAVADECLRQMEWTQRSGDRVILLGEVVDHHYGLTLAPEDWKP